MDFLIIILVVVLLLSFVYPFFWLIGIGVSLGGLILGKRGIDAKVVLCLLILFVGLIKGVFTYQIYDYMFNKPSKLSELKQFYTKYPYLKFITFFEVGIFEEIIRSRYFKTKSFICKLNNEDTDTITEERVRSSSIVDPLGHKVKLANKKGRILFYSIGPDGTDDDMTIKYDPTNGTISTGDVFDNSRKYP